MAPQVTATVVDDDPQSYESKHVHAVYDEIAPHFSSTRYKVRSSSTHPNHSDVKGLTVAMANHLSIYFVSACGMGGTRLWHREWQVSPASQ